jgi:membrane-associated phospholipid phosphatase
MYCELGFGCIDAEFIAPRYWQLRRHWHDPFPKVIVERDGFLFGDHFYRPAWRYTGNVWRDYTYFYAPHSLCVLAMGVGSHAILANTSLDQDFRDWFQDNAVGDTGAFKWAKFLGETWVIVPAAVGLWAIDEWIDRRGWFGHRGPNQDVGGWARQTCRALLVGAPAIWALQVGIGSSRPTDLDGDSRWRPFHDNNGASGHTFAGAVPFLVAAKRTDNLLLKSVLVFGSGLPGYSRLYDDAHYLSQVLLGYCVAALAVEATELTERAAFQYRLVPLDLRGGIGLGVEFRR